MNTGRQVRIDTCLQPLLYFFTDKVSLTPPLASGGGRLFLEQEAVKKWRPATDFSPSFPGFFVWYWPYRSLFFFWELPWDTGCGRKARKKPKVCWGFLLKHFKNWLTEWKEQTGLSRRG